jgi:hypothetical protein
MGLSHYSENVRVFRSPAWTADATPKDNRLIVKGLLPLWRVPAVIGSQEREIPDACDVNINVTECTLFGTE